jgi:hypothetical protein
MRKLILLALLLPLLCSAGNFGYSYEEEEKVYGFDAVGMKTAVPLTKTVGIFKVYLDYNMPKDRESWYDLILNVEFDYNGLHFELIGEQAADGRDSIWVENVRELPRVGWYWKYIGGGQVEKRKYVDDIPTHAEAWEIRCRAIAEIERLKEINDAMHYARDCHICHYIKFKGMDHLCKPVVIDEYHLRMIYNWEYCPHCGKKLK